MRPRRAFLKEIAVASDEETIEVGRSIGTILTPGSIVALEGPLGAGKTTLVKGIAAALGVAETITSPTFTIVSEYAGRFPLYHIDLYRVGSVEEIELLGLEELLYGRGVSIVEWSDKAPGLFLDPIRVVLTITGPTQRLLRVTTPEEVVLP